MQPITANSNSMTLKTRDKAGTILISFGFDGFSSRSAMEGESAMVAALCTINIK
jgi:hypothetical protein